MKISNIKNYNIEKYVKLHLENLPNDFFSLLGEKLCKKYKPSLLILVHVLGHANNMKLLKKICSK